MLRLKQTLAGAALILTTRLLEISQQIRSMEGGYFSLGGRAQLFQTVLGKLVAMSPEVCDSPPTTVRVNPSPRR